MNPLEMPETFFITLANPNPTSSKTKDGPKYRVSFELEQSEWQDFMDAETSGMVIECACQVSHRNTSLLTPEQEAKANARDPDTVDLIDGVTDKEKLKGGPLSVRSDALARDEDFMAFVGVSDPDAARAYIRSFCSVTSRAELDHDAGAADRFRMMLSEFTKWCAEAEGVM